MPTDCDMNSFHYHELTKVLLVRAAWAGILAVRRTLDVIFETLLTGHHVHLLGIDVLVASPVAPALICI